MYTNAQAQEQIPGLLNRLNKLIQKESPNALITVDIADGYADIQLIEQNGNTRMLLAAALGPMQTWRYLHMFIDFVDVLHRLAKEFDDGN